MHYLGCSEWCNMRSLWAKGLDSQSVWMLQATWYQNECKIKSGVPRTPLRGSFGPFCARTTQVKEWKAIVTRMECYLITTDSVKKTFALQREKKLCPRWWPLAMKVKGHSKKRKLSLYNSVTHGIVLYALMTWNKGVWQQEKRMKSKFSGRQSW